MPTYDKRHSFTQIALAAVAAARFVTRNGTHASASSDVAGISEAAASVGRAFSTLTSFSGFVEAAETIADGALVKPAADGSGRVAVGSSSDNCGWAVSGAAAGGLVTVHPVERMQSVSGAGISVAVSASRSAIAADSGATLELASGITYTLDSAVPLSSGVILIGPASGSATLAVTGSATTNGATAAITISAGQIATAVPRASSSSAYIVKVS